MSVPERVCETCGEPYAGTAWHETGACLIACVGVIRRLREEVQTHRVAAETWRARWRDAIGATDDPE